MPVSQAGPSSRSSRDTASSLDIPALHPLSHSNPLLNQSQFDPDAFLQTRSHIPLDELRGELREYLAGLREELIQLINEDYEEFISLGTGLRGEAQRLEALRQPLQLLSNESSAVRDILMDHQSNLQSKLDDRARLRDEKTLLEVLQKLHDTIARSEAMLKTLRTSNKDVFRMAGDYTQIIYLMTKAETEGCQICNTLQPRVTKMKRSLGSELASLLRSAIQIGSASDIRQCLKAYDMIEGWTEVQDELGQDIRGLAQRVLQASALDTPLTPLAPHTPHSSKNPFDKLPDDTALGSVYNKCIDELEPYRLLAEVAEEVSDRFDFLPTVIWPEIEAAIRLNLGPTLFAAGRPAELHRNHTLSYRFIALLEDLSPSEEGVIRMRKSPASALFQRQWQLPVYYQLRWKEITGRLERSLANPPASDWAFAASGVFWTALTTCWSEDIYIPELGQRFWRLMLQIISRYQEWVKTCEPKEGTLQWATSALLDTTRMSKLLGDLLSQRDVQIQIPNILSIHTYRGKILSTLMNDCAEPLKLVRSVASQLRSSNAKTGPSGPSQFIPTVFRPLTTFFANAPTLLGFQAEWATEVAEHVFSQYASILLSVRKTEDLLRRHRKSKKAGFSLFGSGTGGEEAEEDSRFNAQMRKDVEYLGQEAEKLGVNLSKSKGWTEVLEAQSEEDEVDPIKA